MAVGVGEGIVIDVAADLLPHNNGSGCVRLLVTPDEADRLVLALQELRANQFGRGQA